MKRKCISFLTFILVALTSLCLFACGESGNVNVEKITLDVDEAGYVSIFVQEGGAEEGTTLLSVMKALKEEGKLTFSEESGMLTEMIGKKNALDYSACWMLYTSDAKMTNDEWGTVTHKEKTYGSAILGANTLEVVEGETYLWQYQTF